MMLPDQPLEGQTLSFTCLFEAVQAPVPKRLVGYRWFLNDVSISNPPSGSRIRIEENPTNGHKYWPSTLMFTPVSKFDSGKLATSSFSVLYWLFLFLLLSISKLFSSPGNISCVAEFVSDASSEIKKAYSVLPLPVVQIYPLTLAVQKNEIINITCSTMEKIWIGEDVQVVTDIEEILWFRNGTRIAAGGKCINFFHFLPQMGLSESEFSSECHVSL